MTEYTDIISKKAALKGIESAVDMFMKRIELLATEYRELQDEIAQLEEQRPGPLA